VTEQVDCVVIGAGVVGLAVARALALSGREVLVLEAARSIGTGTSSRNSEVIHAGIYYPTGSLKARFCVAGRRMLYDYAVRQGVEHRRLGKYVVATTADEVPILKQYQAQAIANGVDDLSWCDADRVHEAEPEVRCVAALLSPSSGIIDSHGLMLSYQGDLENHGGTVAFEAAVVGGELLTDGVELDVDGAARMTLRARVVVNSAGLDAQAVSSKLRGLPADRVPPRYLAKGHYFSMVGRPPFRHLVYPVANSAGLGTHVTLDLSGNARFGPDVLWLDTVDYSFDAGRKQEFLRAIRLYYPEMQDERLQPAYTGIRPKLGGPREPAADFCISGPAQHGRRPYVALYGIESPGLTASLAIGEHVLGLLR
jgi:L-2-hydroxyglutarate oxidase LhgO